jgi:hypothetical protein
LKFKTYERQYTHIVSDSFETAGCYTKNLKAIGVHAFDIISNAAPLQDAWIKENNLKTGITIQELLVQQLKFYRPDVVWIDDFSFVNAEWKKNLIEKVPSVKLLIGHICAPYNSEMEEKFKLLDIMFTCTPCFKNQLEKQGIKTYLIYHGFEKSVLDNINYRNSFPVSDVLFSGSLYTGSGFHKNRIEYIERMLEAGIKADLYCNLESWRRVMAKKGAYAVINTLKSMSMENLTDRIPVLKKNKKYGDNLVRYYSRKLIARSKPPVFGYNMFRLLSRAKICFNMHGEIAGKCAGNIRMFEATGVASCLVTDWKENINELFEPDKEVVAFKSVEECIDRVKWLLNNPLQRHKIAAAGHKKTLSEHTIEKRAKLVNEIIGKELI